MADNAPKTEPMAAAPRILVTGAGGFVGQPLCQALSADGYRVIGTVRQLWHGLPAAPETVFRETGDLESFKDWAPLLRGVDAVVHLAARVHVMGQSGAAALAGYRAANAAVTETLIRAAATAGVRRFVFLSSVKALGEGGAVPYSEMSVAQPTDPYGISKLEAEQIIAAVGKKTGLETVILRLPLVYGPGVRANFLRLIKLTDRGLPLPLASVDNRRSMIYLGNLVDAVRVCLHHPKAAAELFMVSDGEDMSTPGLIRKISGALHKKPRLLPFPPLLLGIAGRLVGKGAEINRLLGFLQADTTKIRHTLDWEPPYSVQQGIFETVAWYRKSISGATVSKR